MKFILFFILLLWPMYSMSVSTTELTNVVYDVKANNIKEFLAQVRLKGPNSNKVDAWAMFKFDLETEFTYQSYSDICTLNEVDIHINAEIIIPKWTNIKTTAPSVQKWWSLFKPYLYQHEIKHYQSMIEVSSKMYESMINMKPEVNCKNLELNYYNLKRKMFTKLQILDRQIDTQTSEELFEKESLIGPIERYIGNKLIIESGMGQSIIGF